jgi:hypothetical protein
MNISRTTLLTGSIWNAIVEYAENTDDLDTYRSDIRDEILVFLDNILEIGEDSDA